jgi:hypothetical protein
MNIREAAAVFDLTGHHEPDEGMERMEDVLFVQKQDVLRESGRPAWIRVRMRRLEHFRDAARTLGFETGGLHDPLPGFAPDLSGPLEFMRSHEAFLSAVRLAVSNVRSFGELMAVLVKWEAGLIRYARLYPEVLGEWLEAYEGEVKQHEAPDTARIISLLRTGSDNAGLRILLSREWKRIGAWPADHS